MTGNDIFSRALNLMGYINSETVKADNGGLMKIAADTINQICVDLKIPEIEKLSDNIDGNSKITDALCYGVAMIIALIEGDTAKNKVFAEIYGSKRALALASKEFIADKLPTTDYGAD